MTWMPVDGETWPNTAASFVGMWSLMMVAMMLPSLVPMLWRYREAVERTTQLRLELLTALAGAGYFAVWAVSGVAVFALGSAFANVAMQRPDLGSAVPVLTGLVILIAGAVQFSDWKMHHLGRCREAPGSGRPLSADATTALWHGLRLGLHCCLCCSNLTAILLVIGLMDLRAMFIVTAAITAERLIPSDQIARATGVIAAGAGLFVIAQSAGLS